MQDHSSLLPVLATLLALSPEERNRLESARNRLQQGETIRVVAQQVGEVCIHRFLLPSCAYILVGWRECVCALLLLRPCVGICCAVVNYRLVKEIVGKLRLVVTHMPASITRIASNPLYLYNDLH